MHWRSLLSRSLVYVPWRRPNANILIQSTTKRSALRITREVELLGGEVSAYHSRENLVLRAKFLREDLPYFTELLAEVISKTRFTGE